MGAQNSAIGECLLNHTIGRVLHSQTKRPFRSRVILCLDSAQPPHYIVGFLKRLLGDELIMKSLLRLGKRLLSPPYARSRRWNSGVRLVCLFVKYKCENLMANSLPLHCSSASLLVKTWFCKPPPA